MIDMPLRIFVGYEPSETVAFHVLAHSIYRHARAPVSVTGLILRQLPLTRARDPRQSTEFAFSRFLVPHLCGYAGVAVFMDCDMLCRADIRELVDAAELAKPVSVVKHDYRTCASVKFLEQQNVDYARKNWSSVMVFSCGMEECRRLSPDYVNAASGLDLHQFRWIDDEERIGALPPAFNHLVGELPPNPAAKLVHFTLGTPCFEKYARCEFAQEWFEERRLMLHHDRVNEYSRPERVEA